MTDSALLAAGTRFFDGGRPIPDRPVKTIFMFVCLMAAVVARRRGGRASNYIRECADFVTNVVGKRLSVGDQLPTEYDWRPSAAIDCAEAMMEYDDDR